MYRRSMELKRYLVGDDYIRGVSGGERKRVRYAALIVVSLNLCLHLYLVLQR